MLGDRLAWGEQGRARRTVSLLKKWVITRACSGLPPSPLPRPQPALDVAHGSSTAPGTDKNSAARRGAGAPERYGAAQHGCLSASELRLELCLAAFPRAAGVWCCGGAWGETWAVAATLHRPPGARGGQQGSWLLKSWVCAAQQPVVQERLGLEYFCVPIRSARHAVTPFTHTSSGSSGKIVRRPGATRTSCGGGGTDARARGAPPRRRIFFWREALACLAPTEQRGPFVVCSYSYRVIVGL
eukprot:scaffold11278_cov145-Isochrysis_galbana.AAC.5